MTQQCYGEEERVNLRQVIESQELWRGTGHENFTARFEKEFGEWLGRKYVLGICSGTCAEETALAGLGLEPGDEVICPASAPIFVSFPVVSIGCVPVFADVDPRTLIISAEGIEEQVTERTRAVMVVHLFGQPAPMDEIMAVAKKHGLQVLEDCAQAYGPTHRGRKVGTIGDVACYSLQQSKHMSSGEGGIVATDEPDIYKRMALFSNCGMPWYGYGMEPPEREPIAGHTPRGHFSFGHNFRMSELQGAVCVAQLKKLPEFNERRKKLVKVIEDELGAVDGIELPYVYPDTEPNYWTYPVRVPAGLGGYAEINYLEAEFQKMQRERRTSLGIPLPDTVQYTPGACPRTEEAVKRFRAISVHHAKEPEEIREAARGIREIVEGKSK
ncbi:MAG: DegT/DnrJ/EryC1/StrS family aminotransferase [Planctomycetes bacterium]|nr:DegT/DnrJ/EryC1/StrS family aminotransferase [Planctomycetota bacterium]